MITLVAYLLPLLIQVFLEFFRFSIGLIRFLWCCMVFFGKRKTPQVGSITPWTLMRPRFFCYPSVKDSVSLVSFISQDGKH